MAELPIIWYQKAMKRIAHDAPEVVALGISEDDLKIYPVLWISPRGEICALRRLNFHWTVVIDMDWAGHRERYCFDTATRAINGFDSWEGLTGTDPEGWHKHPTTKRCRDIETGEEWKDGEISPRDLREYERKKAEREAAEKAAKAALKPPKRRASPKLRPSRRPSASEPAQAASSDTSPQSSG